MGIGKAQEQLILVYSLFDEVEVKPNYPRMERTLAFFALQQPCGRACSLQPVANTQINVKNILQSHPGTRNSMHFQAYQRQA